MLIIVLFSSQYYGFWLDNFQTTPPIPTYLVGLFVGELKKSDKYNGSNVNVYTYQDYLSQTDHVMEESSTLFQTMENYTDIKSNLNKMDFLTIPDLGGDATENWGINVYRLYTRSHRFHFFIFKEISLQREVYIV